MVQGYQPLAPILTSSLPPTCTQGGRAHGGIAIVAGPMGLETGNVADEDSFPHHRNEIGGANIPFLGSATSVKNSDADVNGGSHKHDWGSNLVVICVGGSFSPREFSLRVSSMDYTTALFLGSSAAGGAISKVHVGCEEPVRDIFALIFPA